MRVYPSDNLGRSAGTSIRMSVSEGTRFERNGSMMATMIESVEETSYAGTNMVQQRGFSPWRREHTAYENSF